VDYFLNNVAESGWHICDYVLACDMEMDPVSGYDFANWERGYGDLHAVIDPATLRIAAWEEKTAIVLCDLLDPRTHKPVPMSPRQMLRDQLAKAAAMGYTAKGGSEYELTLFDESFEEAEAKGFHELTPSGRYQEDYHILKGTRHEPIMSRLRHVLDSSGVPVEFTKGEAGFGQQELNLKFSEVLEQADRNLLYKHAAKEVAAAQKRSLTFMAKWHHDHTGSSAHLHLSLWNKSDRTSLFKGNVPFGPVVGSDEFRWFLGGWIKHAREMAVCYAPYPASYKRYQSRSWAPTSLAWSADNRTAGFRVVGSDSSLRVECRLPGADANPYVAYAASLASGLDGIRNKIEPPAAFDGDVYAARELPQIPKTSYEAIDAFANSDFAKEALGADVHAHYLRFVQVEQEKFDAVVTNWERQRYFERA
jgi:glutamine synthetase